jgi:hypothetical protein
MPRRDNFDPPIAELVCPKCGSEFQVVQRWVNAPAAFPRPCSVCGEQFLEHNTGKREKRGKVFMQNYVIEYVMMRPKSRPQFPEPPTEI